eukprot:7733352-Pyramimonas_sp.AAC.1
MAPAFCLTPVMTPVGQVAGPGAHPPVVAEEIQLDEGGLGVHHDHRPHVLVFRHLRPAGHAPGVTHTKWQGQRGIVNIPRDSHPPAYGSGRRDP